MTGMECHLSAFVRRSRTTSHRRQDPSAPFRFRRRLACCMTTSLSDTTHAMPHRSRREASPETSHSASDKPQTTGVVNKAAAPRLSPLRMVIGLGLAGFGLWLIAGGFGPTGPSGKTAAVPERYDADRAMGYLKTLCEFGPRPSGSEAMKQQQDYLESFFQDLGAEVTRQSFEARHPLDGNAVKLTNLIASWHPQRPIRFLFCAHYDTRPYPDSDSVNPRGTFIGANDGASGTAGLMELAHQLHDLPDNVGVDLVLFDGEELVFKNRLNHSEGDYFLGSTHFAQQYVLQPPAVPYRAGVLFDMIGDKELLLFTEKNSLRFARPVVKSFWKEAKTLGVTLFIDRARPDVRDDHLPLNRIAKIPSIDVIDFDYPRPGIGAPSYWHTEQDIPANCSGTSIATVVWVARSWLDTQSQQQTVTR